MELGKRVRVVGGRKGLGVTGTVFWVGQNRFGEGTRLGVEGDDGQTWWLDAAHVEPTDAPPPPAAGPPLEKGARVRWRQGDQEGLGTVFWYGQSKGPRGGMRVGVNDLQGETRWLDARLVEVVSDDDPALAPADGAGEPIPDLPPAPPDEDPGPGGTWEWDDESPPF